MARTPVTETFVSQSIPTPFEQQTMDATSVATTLSGAVNGVTQYLPVSAYVVGGNGLNNSDVLLLGNAERALILIDTFLVKVSAIGTPDSITWTRNGVSPTTVNITGSAQALTAGVTIAFAATTGHTLNDQWVITVNAGVIAAVDRKRVG